MASRFSEELKGRGRCMIAHPVNPPHVVPIVEIALLITVGNAIGFWPTFAIVVATAFLGSWLVDALVQQGASVVGLVRDHVPQSMLFRNGIAIISVD